MLVREEVDIMSIKRNGGKNVKIFRDFVDFEFDEKKYRAYFEARRFGWYVFELRTGDDGEVHEFTVPKRKKVVGVALGYEVRKGE